MTPFRSTATGESTRRRITAYLRRGARTVEELARAVDTSDNAVRAHLAALERDGLVRHGGVRRGGGAGKPASVFELTTNAELSFSKAYPPVLNAVLDAMVNEMSAERAESLLRNVGDILATSMGGAAGGDLHARAHAAADALNALGGDVDVRADADGFVLQGHGCPLSATVSHRPEACRAVESLVSAITGTQAQEKCVHGERPQCRFHIPQA